MRMIQKGRAASVAAKAIAFGALLQGCQYQYTLEPPKTAPDKSEITKPEPEQLKVFCTKQGEGRYYLSVSGIDALIVCGEDEAAKTQNSRVAKRINSVEDAAPLIDFCEKKRKGEFSVYENKNHGIITCLDKSDVKNTPGENANPGPARTFVIGKSMQFSSLAGYIDGKKIVLFGENHGVNYDDLHFAVDIIRMLKEKGFTHLAIEMGSEMQGYIDSYSLKKDGKSRQKLYEMLTRMINVQRSVDAFFILIDSALSEGMKVVCVDVTENLAERDLAMKKKISEIADAGKKVAIFVGIAHISNAEEDYFLHEDSKVELPRDGAPYKEGKVVVEWQKISFKPLGRLLIESYGAENVGIVSLVAGECLNADVCIDYPWASQLKKPGVPGTGSTLGGYYAP